MRRQRVMSPHYKLPTSLLVSAPFELIFTFHPFTVTHHLTVWFMGTCAHYICCSWVFYVLYPDVQHYLFNVMLDTLFLQKMWCESIRHCVKLFHATSLLEKKKDQQINFFVFGVRIFFVCVCGYFWIYFLNLCIFHLSNSYHLMWTLKILSLVE